MRLKLTLNRPGQQPTDLLTTFDAGVTVGQLAAALRARRPSGEAPEGDVSLRVDGPTPRVLDASATVIDAGLRSGAAVTIAADDGGKWAPDDTGAAELLVLDGPGAGQRHPLRTGANYVGRDRGNDIRLEDPLVSKRHARITIGEGVEIVDLGAANGVLVGGEQVSRGLLRATDEIVLGDTVLRVVYEPGARAEAVSEGIGFNRSPALDIEPERAEIELPEPPERPGRQRFPWVPMAAPILMGCLLFAITRQLYSVVFVALSPIMALGNIIETKVVGRRTYRDAVAAFEDALEAVRRDLEVRAEREVDVRRRAHPAIGELLGGAEVRSPLLWRCRPDRPGFLEVRIGEGRLASMTATRLPKRTAAQSPDLWPVLHAIQDGYECVDDVPGVVSLTESGSLGIAGPRAAALAHARAVVGSITASHSPAEVALAVVTSSDREQDWVWVKWLPHVGVEHERLGIEQLASAPATATRLMAALDDLIATREQDERAEGPQLPAVVLVVDDASVERSRLVDVAERGPSVGVHLVWVAPTVGLLPAACRAFVEIDLQDTTVATLSIVGNPAPMTLRLDTASEEECVRFSRSLSPVQDAGARFDDASDLPSTISLLSILGPELARASDQVIERWRASGSLGAGGGGPSRRTPRHLRAAVGVGVGQTFVLDLREHGPHALVGGTTGSGKSEFLQSWVMALAADHSPSQLTFLFVDYKGGAAFGECVQLPHAVGLVTDLSPHLVQRALTSLNAELRHREEVLRQKKAKDLLDLEGDPDAPPSLVIVVDEFAALVAEVPEFVDGVVNVAQRGRSLGLHLVLATQRPAGVIKDNLRANTNLRIALRMADVDDSVDVIGTGQAGGFDPSLPGRAVAKTGPGRLTQFQAGYLGGWTSDIPPAPAIEIREFPFGPGRTWEEPEELVPAVAVDPGPNDLHRLVATIKHASESLHLPAPRKPWLPELAPVYDLARLPHPRTDAQLVFAVLDDPERQRQVPVAFEPGREGNMAVYGTGGSGKTTVLRTLAVSAGLATRSGPCHVYGVDFAGRGLSMLEPLPHVGAVIAGEDHERLTRLLRWLRTTIDERAVAFAQVRAGSLEEYRVIAAAPDHPRILVLIDGMAAFRSAYDSGDRVRWLDLLNGIATDGRQVGVHLVVAADRTSSVPPALASAIQRRLVLRMAGEQDYSMAEVAHPDVLESAPPGRGLLGEAEVQVAVLGGTTNVQLQAHAVDAVAAEMGKAMPRPAPMAIGRLTDNVTLGRLQSAVGGLATLGIADDTLAPIGFSLEDPLLVLGPAGSGVTSALAALTLSYRRSRPEVLAHLIGAPRSPLQQLPAFAGRAAAYADGLVLAEALLGEVAAGKFNDGNGLVVLEDVPSMIEEGLEQTLLELVRSCVAHEVALIASVDSSAAGGFAQLLQALRSKRHGLALQPEQHEGEQVFKTPFPRINRSEFPPGRGFYVRKGNAVRVQCALPDLDE